MKTPNQAPTVKSTPETRSTTPAAGRRRRWLLAPLALALCAQQAAVAAPRNWAGAGADNNWNTTLNWDTVPVNNDSVVFTTQSKVINTNNIASLLLSGITFNTNGFALYGTSITNSVGITDNAGSNSVNIIQSLNASITINNSGGPGQYVTNITTVGAAITNNGFNVLVTGAGNVNLNGIVGGTNAASIVPYQGGVTMNGTGTLRLAAANTFYGGLTNTQGTVQMGNNGGNPSGAGRGDTYINGTLDMDAFSPTFNGLYGTGSIVNSAGAGTYTITVGNNATNSAGNFSGQVVPASGIVALSKINTNTFTYNGGASYTGPTTINAGSLVLGPFAVVQSSNIIVMPGTLLDVSTINAGAFVMSYGGLVAGRATNPAAGAFASAPVQGAVGLTTPVGYDIYGNVVNNSGPMVIFSAGARGTMSINGSLTVNGIMQFDLGNTTAVGGGANDLIIINGTLTLGTATIYLNPAAGSFLSGGTYTLISNVTGAAVSGSVSGLTAATPRGATATFSIDAFNNLTVQITGSGAEGNLVWATTNITTTLNNWDVQVSEDWFDGGTTTPDYFYNLDNVTFNDSGYNTVTIAQGVSPSSTTVSNTVLAYTFTGAGSINGSGGFTKNGTNIVIFQTPNTYLGDTVLNGGALVLGTQTAAPALNEDIYASVTPGNVWLNGAGLYMYDAANNAYTLPINNLEIGPGANALTTRARQSSSAMQAQIQQVVRNGVGGTFDLNVGQKTSSPQCGTMISNTTTINAILGGWATFANADWLVPTNVLEGSLNYGNTADGAGSMGTYQTGTTPSAWGATSNVSLTASPAAAISADMTINSLKILGASLTNNAGVTLTLNTGGLLMPVTAGSAASIVGGTLLGALNADLIVHQWNAASALTIGSVIADNTNGSATMGSALTKSGQGTLILTNANTYSGPTYINGPTLLNQPNATTPTWSPAGTLQLGAGGSSGSISNTSFITNSGTLVFDRADTSGYAGVISGLGGVKQIGAGTTVLGNDETYFGVTTITAGTLQIGAGGSTGSISNSVSVADGGTLAFNNGASATYPGVITGAGAVVNAGTGTTILAGTNTYTGPTVVTAGTLALGPTGSISNSVLVSNVAGSTVDFSAAGGLTLSTFASGQVLALAGNVKGNVVVSGSTTAISPGGAGTIGTAAFNNNLTLSGGKFIIDVNYPSWDSITVGQTLALNSGAVTLNNIGGLIPNGTYLLASAANITGSAANISPPSLGQAGQNDYLTNTLTGLYLVVESGAGANLTWIGNGGNNFWDVDNTADWNNGSGASVFHNGDFTTLNDTGEANSTVNINAVVGPGAVTNNSEVDYTYQGAGRISLGASLTKMDTDNLNILTTNDYSGYTAILGGTINVGNGSASGSLGTGPVSNNTALVFNIPDTQSIAGAMSGAGTLTLNGGGEVNLLGNNSAYSGPITVNSGVLQVGASIAGGGTSGTLGTGPVVNNSLLVFNRSGAAFTYPGGISGSGIVSNSGTGTVILSGSNFYTGNTIIATGTIKAGSTNAIPNGTGSGNLELDGVASGTAGVLDLNGFDTYINGLVGAVGTLAPGTVANNAGSATHTLVIGTGGATATYSGRIVDNTGSGGSVGLLIEGGATQTIDVESVTGNTYSGGTVISNATVTLTSAYAGGNNPYPGANSVALGTGPVTLYGSTLNLVGSPQSLGSTSPTWTPGLANTVIVPAGQIGTVSGCTRGPFSPVLQGGGTFVYIVNYVRGSVGGNWSGFTGQVFWQSAAGTDQLGINANTGGFYKVFCTNGLILYSLVSGTPTISFGELADDGTTSLTANSADTSGQAAIYSVGSANTSTNFGGSILDSVGIAKVGTGTWTLTSTTNTYTGSTTVSNGVLAFTGGIPSNTTPWTIAAPGILDVSTFGTLYVGTTVDQTLLGNGTIRGSLTAGAAAVLQPGGAGIGTLTVTGSVALGGSIAMKLNTTNGVQTNDMVSATNIVLGGTLTINNTGPTLITGDTFQLFSATNVTGGFTAVSLPANDGNGTSYTWSTNQLVPNGVLTLLSGGTPVSPVNTNATNITYSFAGGVLTLSWPTDHTGWLLQAQTNPPNVGITTNWVTVSGSQLTNTNSFNISTSNTVFYRMIYQ